MPDGLTSRIEERMMEVILQMIPKIGVILVALIAGIVAAKLARKIVLTYGQRTAKKIGIELDEKVVEYSARSIRYIIYAFVLIVISTQLGLEATSLVFGVLILLMMRPAVEIARVVYQNFGIRFLRGIAGDVGIALEDRIYEQSFNIVKILIYGIAIILAGKAGRLGYGASSVCGSNSIFCQAALRDSRRVHAES